MNCLKEIRGVGSKVVKDVYGQEWTLSDIEEFEMTETGDYRGALVFSNGDNEQRGIVVLMQSGIPEEKYTSIPSLLEVNMGNFLDKTNPVRIVKDQNRIRLEVSPGPIIRR